MSGVFARFERGRVGESARPEKDPKLRADWRASMSWVCSEVPFVSEVFGAGSDCRLKPGRRGDLGGSGGEESGGEVVEAVSSILDFGESEKDGGGPATPTRRERGSLLGGEEVGSAIEVIWILLPGRNDGVAFQALCQKEEVVLGLSATRESTLFCVRSPTGTRHWILASRVRNDERAERVCALEDLTSDVPAAPDCLDRFSIHVKAVRAGTTVTPHLGSSTRGI